MAWILLLISIESRTKLHTQTVCLWCMRILFVRLLQYIFDFLIAHAQFLSFFLLHSILFLYLTIWFSNGFFFYFEALRFIVCYFNFKFETNGKTADAFFRIFCVSCFITDGIFDFDYWLLLIILFSFSLNQKRFN